jgi:hypothetical protein
VEHEHQLPMQVNQGRTQDLGGGGVARGDKRPVIFHSALMPKTSSEQICVSVRSTAHPPSQLYVPTCI